jgi:DNA-binding CsgD family transcriptional regulator
MDHQLPAGLQDNNTEIFGSQCWSTVSCISNGAIIPFESFDEDLLNTVEIAFNQSPDKVVNTRLMTKTDDRLANLKQFLLCNYGRFDNHPDIIDGVMQLTEYPPCPMRGTCNFEGRVCDGLRTDTGAILTNREMEYVKLTALGYLDKLIAGKWSVSLHTARTHGKNVRKKLGLNRKADITRFAIQKNLI